MSSSLSRAIQSNLRAHPRVTRFFKTRHETFWGFFYTLAYHMYTGWLFIASDFRSHMVIAPLFGAMNAFIAPRLSMGPPRTMTEILWKLPKALLWCWSNLFLFNLHNQRHPEAIVEDSINKPWRPLPSGRLTPEQATWTMYAMYPVTLGIALTCGGLWPCLIVTALGIWYNELGGDSTPAIKNFLNGPGIACALAGPLEVFTEHSIFDNDAKGAIWLGIIAAAIATTIQAQDFRDKEGDKATGRTTLPLAIGDMNARISDAIGITAWNVASCWFWQAGWKEASAAWTLGLTMLTNLFLRRNKAGDVLTWKLYQLWLIGLFMVPFVGGLYRRGYAPSETARPLQPSTVA